MEIHPSTSPVQKTQYVRPELVEGLDTERIQLEQPLLCLENANVTLKLALLVMWLCLKNRDFLFALMLSRRNLFAANS